MSRKGTHVDRADYEQLLASYPDILTVEEVANVLRVTPRSVQRWARDKRIPSIRAGRTYRFPRSAVLHWLERATLRLSPTIDIDRQ